MYIFYTEPKDIMQELAATELTHRNWRYHKVLQAWLTKDQIVEPIQVSPGTERGSYIFFNQSSWQRMRQDFLLNYEDLDDHIPSNGNGNANLIGQGNLSSMVSNLS